MLTVITGASGRGKTTMARDLAGRDGREVVSAGQWIRSELDERGHGSEVASRLSAASAEILADDPTRAARWLEKVIAAKGRNLVVVEGVRNPLDLLSIVRQGDTVIDVGGEGAEGWERDGLRALRACRPLVERCGVLWSEAPRHFATLPEPLAMSVSSAVLHADDSPDAVAGKLIALESYAGAPVTAAWVSDGGGMFHDLPLSALVGRSLFEAPGDALEYARAHPLVPQPCYSASGVGSPVIERAPIAGDVAIFSVDRKRIGTGTAGWLIHWPDDNLLLHLVEEQFGRVLLWPPHKLMWSVEAEILPDWKKLRTSAGGTQ